MVIYHCPAFFSFYQLHKIHQCNILHILAERSHQRRIAQLGPYIFHLIEKHYEQVVKTKFRFVLTPQYHIDSGMYPFQVCHHRTHHATRQTAFQKEGRHIFVGRIHEVAQKIIYKFLCHGTGLHIRFHINIGNSET